MRRSAGGMWFVRCTEVVRFSECPLSEVSLYIIATGLQNGESYTISIVATSQHLPSESIAVDMEVMLGEDIHVQIAVKTDPTVCAMAT